MDVNLVTDDSTISLRGITPGFGNFTSTLAPPEPTAGSFSVLLLSAHLLLAVPGAVHGAPGPAAEPAPENRPSPAMALPTDVRRGIHSIDAADVNGDGRDDVLVVQSPSEAVDTTRLVLFTALGERDGGPPTAIDEEISAELIGARFADMDHDGDPDIVAVSHGRYVKGTPVDYQPATVTIYVNPLISVGGAVRSDSEAEWLVVERNLIAFPGAFHLSDMDGNGLPDVVVIPDVGYGPKVPDRRLQVLYNRGPLRASGWLESRQVATLPQQVDGSSLAAHAVGDLTYDNLPDIALHVAGSGVSDSILVYEQTAEGEFNDPVVTPVSASGVNAMVIKQRFGGAPSGGSDPRFLVTADRHDSQFTTRIGLNDVSPHGAIGQPSGHIETTYELKHYFEDKDSGAGKYHRLGFIPEDSHLVDIDGDGWIDLITAGSRAGGVAVAVHQYSEQARLKSSYEILESNLPLFEEVWTQSVPKGCVGKVRGSGEGGNHENRGITASAGDVDGDGHKEILVSTGSTPGARVLVLAVHGRDSRESRSDPFLKLADLVPGGEPEVLLGNRNFPCVAVINDVLQHKRDWSDAFDDPPLTPIREFDEHWLSNQSVIDLEAVDFNCDGVQDVMALTRETDSSHRLQVRMGTTPSESGEVKLGEPETLERIHEDFVPLSLATRSCTEGYRTSNVAYAYRQTPAEQEQPVRSRIRFLSRDAETEELSWGLQPLAREVDIVHDIAWIEDGRDAPSLVAAFVRRLHGENEGLYSIGFIEYALAGRHYVWNKPGNLPDHFYESWVEEEVKPGDDAHVTLSVGDVDGYDGEDIIVLVRGFEESGIHVVRNAAMVQTYPWPEDSPLPSSESIAMGDLNGDGYDDLVAAVQGEGRVFLDLNVLHTLKFCVSQPRWYAEVIEDWAMGLAPERGGTGCIARAVELRLPDGRDGAGGDVALAVRNAPGKSGSGAVGGNEWGNVVIAEVSGDFYDPRAIYTVSPSLLRDDCWSILGYESWRVDDGETSLIDVKMRIGQVDGSAEIDGFLPLVVSDGLCPGRKPKYEIAREPQDGEIVEWNGKGYLRYGFQDPSEPGWDWFSYRVRIDNSVVSAPRAVRFIIE